jgi:hypothetical protein
MMIGFVIRMSSHSWNLLDLKTLMTKISISGGEEFFTRKYADPKTCTYYAYNCCYSGGFFYLVDPKTFEAMGATRNNHFRNQIVKF